MEEMLKKTRIMYGNCRLVWEDNGWKVWEFDSKSKWLWRLLVSTPSLEDALRGMIERNVGEEDVNENTVD